MEIRFRSVDNVFDAGDFIEQSLGSCEIYVEQVRKYLSQPDENFIIHSTVLDRYKSEDCMMGIDEAGRGPVLGPMVYACSYAPCCADTSLKQMGFADSKVLTEVQREKLLAAMHDCDSEVQPGYFVNIISPHYITTQMLAKYKVNLNMISQDAAAHLIQLVLDAGVRLTEVYVDTVGPPDKYQAKLAAMFPQLKIVVESKADSTYGIVSAASICAKVTRDRCLQQWNFLEARDFSELPRGSGYPGDPVTKAFMEKSLDEIFGYPQIVRSSWSTAAAIVDKRCVPVQWEDHEAEDTTHQSKSRKRTSLASEKGNQSLFAFVNVTQQEKQKIKSRFQFFMDRKMERVQTLS